MPVFKPEGGEPLVVRSTIGAVPENNSKTHMLPMTQLDFAGARPATGAKVRFGQLTQSSFFARHNPQPGRVRHIKGLLDFPICAVHDDGFVRYPRLRLRDKRNADVRQSLPVRLPVQSINYHPNHINPPLQGHQVNQLEASKYYQRFPLSVRERADPQFGLRLLDVPICAVHDDGFSNDPSVLLKAPSSPERRKLYSFHIPRISSAPYRIFNQNPMLNSHRYPINTITGMSTYPKGFKDLAVASKNREHIPYTEAWRDELVSLVDKAGLGLPKDVKEFQREQPKRTSVYSAETGRLIPPPSRAMSRGSSRQRQREPFLHIMPEQSNETLTDSIAAVQEWLVASGDQEKDLALNIIRTAIGAEETYWKPNDAPQASSFENLYNNRPMSQPPSNMIVENGYGEVDRPSPKPRISTSMARLGTSGGYSRYSYDGDKNKPGSPAGELQYSFEGNDHPSLKPPSRKPDIFRVDHSPRPTSRPQTQQSLSHNGLPASMSRSQSVVKDYASSLPGAAQRTQPIGSPQRRAPSQ
ncbi:Protein TBATA [Holothuria leucospilota]|uniref:Protein TBATA n=1 Tax=Holothuria leucospilota TaxID=206669 RepID=A0A9Q0YID3_HOLLE|nr:Protein TBATA [Holothuria leucospilota]